MEFLRIMFVNSYCILWYPRWISLFAALVRHGPNVCLELACGLARTAEIAPDHKECNREAGSLVSLTTRGAYCTARIIR